VEKLQTRMSSLHVMGIHRRGREKYSPGVLDKEEENSIRFRPDGVRQRTKATQTLQVSCDLKHRTQWFF